MFAIFVAIHTFILILFKDGGIDRDPSPGIYRNIYRLPLLPPSSKTLGIYCKFMICWIFWLLGPC